MALQDKLKKKDVEFQKDSQVIYPPHLSTSAMLIGIKEGVLHQGTFRASRDNFLEGFVSVEGYDEPVRICMQFIIPFDYLVLLGFSTGQRRSKQSS